MPFNCDYCNTRRHTRKAMNKHIAKCSKVKKHFREMKMIAAEEAYLYGKIHDLTMKLNVSRGENVGLEREKSALFNEKRILHSWIDHYQRQIQQQRNDIEWLERNRLPNRVSNPNDSDVLQNVQTLLDGMKERVNCCICLENDLNKDNSHITKCLHRFHKECWRKYSEAQNNDKCPICRQ